MKLFKSLLVLTTAIASLSSCKKDHPSQPAGPAGPLWVTSFAPTRTAKDSVIIVTGENFSSIPSGNIVTINTVPATVVFAGANMLTVKVPLHAGTGILEVKVGDQTASVATIFQYLYTVTTLAGDGKFGFKEGAGNVAEFNAPNSAGSMAPVISMWRMSSTTGSGWSHRMARLVHGPGMVPRRIKRGKGSPALRKAWVPVRSLTILPALRWMAWAIYI